MRAVQPTPARPPADGGAAVALGITERTRNGRFFRKVDSVALLACCGTREPEIAAKVEGRESRKVAPSPLLLRPSLSLLTLQSISKERASVRRARRAQGRTRRARKDRRRHDILGWKALFPLYSSARQATTVAGRARFSGPSMAAHHPV